MATCATCKQPIQAHRGAGQPRRYCSNACKQKAYRQTRKARERRILSQRPTKRPLSDDE
jgi:hypothetical protein